MSSVIFISAIMQKSVWRSQARLAADVTALHGGRRLCDRCEVSAGVRKTEPPAEFNQVNRLCIVVRPARSQFWIQDDPEKSAKRCKTRVVLALPPECRDEARRLIAPRVDPSAKRKAEHAASSDTFEAIASEYLQLKSAEPQRPHVTSRSSLASKRSLSLSSASYPSRRLSHHSCWWRCAGLRNTGIRNGASRALSQSNATRDRHIATHLTGWMRDTQRTNFTFLEAVASMRSLAKA